MTTSLSRSVVVSVSSSSSSMARGSVSSPLALANDDGSIWEGPWSVTTEE